MRRTTALMIMIILVAGTVTTAWAGKGCGRGCGGGGGNGGGNGGDCASFQNTPKEDLSAAEEQSLLLMREEEKLARDVYLTLGEKYDHNVFFNIARAEQRHMDRVADLLERYDVADPITSDERGSFTSPELQELYHQLVQKGESSLVDAMLVGATIEDLDISDLNTALSGPVDNQDIIMVYENLNKGSRNHMRSFMAQLDDSGTEYKAQFISQEELQQIVESDWERGPAQGKGQGRQGGRGNGKGRGQRCG